jgi:hypothetical protein
MKHIKILIPVMMVLFLFSCSAFAVGMGFGMRGMGMGGTGIAIANDIVSAAYFNPAGLMYAPDFETQLSAAGNPDIVTAAGNKNFLADNFDADMNINNAAASSSFGLSLRKVGISVLTNATGSLSHNGGSTLSGGANAQAIAMVPVTFGTVLSKPETFPSTAVGMNIKSVQLYGGGLNILLGAAAQSQLAGTGMGFDFGIQTKLTPTISYGLVVRNIATSYTVTNKTQLGTIDGSGTFTAGGLETSSKSTNTIAPEVGIGIGFGIPITGTLIACDLENYSYPDNGNANRSKTANDLHIGIEQGILFNALMLRVGYFNYAPTDDTFYTCGVGMNAGLLSIGIAEANSQKDSTASSLLVQIGVEL